MLKQCNKHLDIVRESYWQHLRFAACFGWRMIGGGVAAILHGLCPGIFQHTGSQTLYNLHDEITARMKQHDYPHDA